jgi:DNA-binding transcriptional regulator PaaX
MNIRKGSLSYLVLLSLEKAAESLDLEGFTYSGQMKALRGIEAHPSKKTLAETVRRLRLKGMVEYERKVDGELLLKLSMLGKDVLADKKEPESDAKYRIVIWDIPESKRTLRDMLRRKLRDWGFVTLQRSVWISQRNVTGQLRRLITDLGIDRWVIVIESDDPTLEGLYAKKKIIF